MKYLATVLFSLLITCSIFGQITRSTSENIVLSNNVSVVNLDLKSNNIEIKETKGSRIIIEAHITLEAVDNASLLEFLISSGRYALENREDATAQSLTIADKKTNNIILVKGQECREKVRYVILMPASVKRVNTINNATAS